MNAAADHLFDIRDTRLLTYLKFFGFLIVTLLATLPPDAVAKKTDRGQIMNYDAKTIDAFNAPNTITTLTGSVKITQGTLLVTGDLAKIYLNGDTQIARIEVTGSPAHIQQLDENNNLLTGDAVKLDYDNINDIAVLTINAVVNQQCRGEFHGDKLTYKTDSSQITGDSGGDGLVHGAVLPKDSAATTTVCAKPPTAQPVPNGERVAGKLAEKTGGPK
jgi:lipopolysaccharide export system protein LptA